MVRVLLLALLSVVAVQAEDVWFRFNKQFVIAHIDEHTGFGSIQVAVAHPTAKPHTVSCGGSDGELHVGVDETDITVPSDQSPTSAPESEADAKWGIVIEPVNFLDGELDEINSVSQGSATYKGYFRIWNEGHYKGAYYPSNPHHVMELHPAWGYDASGAHFDHPETIYPMAGYAGYGATKFKVVFQGIQDDQWLQAYENGDDVYIQLRHLDNFYQLPVTVLEVSDFDGGRELKVDVYSDKAHKNLVYEGLVVHMLTSDFASGLEADTNTFLLGVFSVNPHRAATIAAGHSSNNPADASGALEFFAFGMPKKNAVASCSSH